MKPEARARVLIDELLVAAGWHICDMAQVNVHAAQGVAIREFPLNTGHGFADYLLYVNGKACDVIEAKKEGATLKGVEIQSEKYAQGLPAALPAWRRPLPFLFENKKNEAEPTLSEADCADMQVFLAHMMGMLPVLGVHAFEQSPKVPVSNAPELTCKGKGLVARGFETTQGFVVKAGSQAAGQVAPSLPEHFSATVAKRQELIDLGVLHPQGNDYAFSQDFACSSPSLASGVVLGRSSNGRLDWKDAQGRALKALQAEV